jgi:hypothetical protein
LRAPASALALLPATAVTVVVLLADRPHLSGSITQWRGDDLAFATTWVAAILCALWLGVTTLGCAIALGRGDRVLAQRVARWAPPIARRVLQAALIGSWALVPANAFAAAPSAPVTVHAGAGGRLVTVPGSPAPVDVQVVRSPSAGAPEAPAGVGPSPALPKAAPPAVAHTHVVRAGENLWRIARAEVARSTAVARPGNDAVAGYWQRVVAANRATLRSGDPSLIFAGEVVTLPSA